MEVRSRPGSVQSSQEISNSAADLLRQGAACNVLYIGSADTESLTGPEVSTAGRCFYSKRQVHRRLFFSANVSLRVLEQNRGVPL